MRDEYDNPNKVASTLTDPRPRPPMATEQAESDYRAKASRSKTWDECSIEEKLERLRNEQRQSREALQYVAKTAVETQTVAERHQHNANGEVLVTPRSGHSGMVGGSSNFDPLR